jgi:hypothetical protein
MVVDSGQEWTSSPTSAPMWMDGALMGVPFSSLPVPGLTKVVSSGWPFSVSLPQPRLVFLGTLFFSPLTPTWVSPPYLHLDYLFMHPGFLPHDLPTLHTATYLPTHLPTYLLTHLPAYLCTYTLNFHQGTNDPCQWGYCNIPSRLLCRPSYIPTTPGNFVTVENSVAMTQIRVLQLH